MRNKEEYPFQNRDSFWQNAWEKANVFKTADDDKKPKKYILDMFPYPSGDGLHVGHPKGYLATDTYCRFLRMSGFNVLHPLGWDAFGLPAEQFALKTGRHPKEAVEKNVKRFKSQIKMLGLGFDWEREINTTDEEYYKWTQWIFLRLFEKDLAYQAEIPVNWCPELKTVLANEEVVNGVSEIGGHPVIRKPMKQWMLKITEYADRLLDDLDDLDWPEPIKEMQRNWIGRSEGANIIFKTADDDNIEVFTTRADTLAGATYMVLAPEHPLVLKISKKSMLEEIKAYQEECSKLSDLERTGTNNEKTGVNTGALAINPLTGKNMQIWISSYVLGHYGTGAIMAVPAHDQRDWDFAKKYDLPIQQVVHSKSFEHDFDKSAFEDHGISSTPVKQNVKTDEAIDLMNEWIEEKGIGKKSISYKLRDWLFSRQRYWGEPIPIIHTENGPVPEEDLPLTLPKLEKIKPTGDGQSPLALAGEWLKAKGGMRETNTMPQWAGSCWYYLRYLDPKNEDHLVSQEIEKKWMPVDLYVGGAEHAVLHLLYARFWHKVLYDVGAVSTKEPFKKLLNQGMIQGSDGQKMSKSRGNVVNPDDVIEKYGSDVFRMYEMFMGPFEGSAPWNTDGISGVKRFLNRSWKILLAETILDDPNENARHKMIIKVTEDLEKFSLNTCISSLMIYLKNLEENGVSEKDKNCFLRVLTPFAPHMCEEINLIHGNEKFACQAGWPKGDPKKAIDDLLEIPIMVNGKLRSKIQVSKTDASNQELLERMSLKEKNVINFLDGRKPKKIIVIKEKIVNIVV